MYYFAPRSDAQSFPGQGHFFKSLKVAISKEPFDLSSFRHYEPWEALCVHQPMCANTRVPTHTDMSTQKCTDTQ